MLDVRAFGRISTPIRVKTSKDKKTLYTSFLLASHEKKETTFIRCVAFNGLATALHDYFVAGDRIIIYGELQKDEYKGQKNCFQLLVNDFKFVETLAEHTKNKEAHPNEDKVKEEQKNDN